MDKDEKYVKMGFLAFMKFYEMNYRGQRQRTYREFMENSFYGAFVKFGRYLLDLQALNPEAFVEFLVKAAIPMKDWQREIVYEQYIRELNKREDAGTAFERNILLMQQWEQDSGEPWYDFFRKVSTVQAVNLIKAGRLSPWVLYSAGTAAELFNRFNDEQVAMIEDYVNPRFWKMKFNQHPEDLEFIRGLLAEVEV